MDLEHFRFLSVTSLSQLSLADGNSCHDRLSHAQHLPQQQHRFAPQHGVGHEHLNMNKHEHLNMMNKQQLQQQLRNHRRASAYGALGGSNGVQITHV